MKSVQLLTALLALLPCVALPQIKPDIRRIYVAPMGGTSEEKLARDNLIAALVESKRFTVVESADLADAKLLASAAESTQRRGLMLNPVDGSVLPGSGSTYRRRRIAARLVIADEIVWALKMGKCADGNPKCVIREMEKAGN